ncbi:hypothetical protein [Blastopirellula marina]|uniref:Lipoprotein n=1 Tax=Blastopirellula marina DSM 3645 TaxID=314230 RepID=A3ZY31_9BACT|nr:hypothetical protein [Blastopirellula marina]EAQ78493.1 hypothetical protein DSM3645_26459 [Blastopirellula marina DSM 3645]
MKVNLVVLGIVAAVAMTLTGCGEQLDSEGYFVVSGEATWNGDPINDGLVIFRTTENGRKNVAAAINDGKFEVKIQPGKKSVEITAMREVPGKFSVGASGEKVPATESFIPKQFNTETEIAVDIAFPDTQELKFELKSP